MSTTDRTDAKAAVFELVTGVWAACAVAATARLGIPDQIASGVCTTEGLAKAVGADAGGLARLLRAAAALGVLTRDAAGRFGLTPLGECLRSDVPGSQRALIASELDSAHWSSLGRLDEAVRTGKPVFDRLFSMPIWDYYRDARPDEGKLFAENMTAQSDLETRAILAAYSFAGAERVVDVGGAHGSFLAAVLRQVPSARGVLFDRRLMIDEARSALTGFGVADRVECVAGDFFESVPAGGDVYLLKHILHDWNDEECIRLLRRVAAAMSPQARVVVAEMMIVEGGPADQEPAEGATATRWAERASPAVLQDLNMLVMLSGKERTQEEYAALFGQAGLRMSGVFPTDSPIFVLEARRR
jgi:predicted O-methyltransferase YrrM